jgi:hypothetical protein
VLAEMRVLMEFWGSTLARRPVECHVAPGEELYDVTPGRDTGVNTEILNYEP